MKQRGGGIGLTQANNQHHHQHLCHHIIQLDKDIDWKRLQKNINPSPLSLLKPFPLLFRMIRKWFICNYLQTSEISNEVNMGNTSCEKECFLSGIARITSQLQLHAEKG